MDISNLRFGDLLAEGKSATAWNVTTTKKDSEGNNTEEAYVLKMFKSEEAFINETAAYKHITEISNLEDRVPRYYGIVPQIPRSILLGKHDGENLEGRVMDLPHLHYHFKAKVTKAMKMLHEGGVSHGNITTKNVIVQADSNVKLVNFAHATLKEDVEEFVWRNCMAMDKCNVKEIFYEAESANAYEEATRILERVRAGITFANAEPQNRLAELLNKMGRPEEALLSFIMDVYKHPEPVLALQLAECLAKYYHHYTEAIEILTEATSRFDTSLLPIKKSNSANSAYTAKMIVYAARYLVELEQGYMDDALPPSHDRYEDAIRFYLHFIDGAGPADMVVLALRYELATHLHSLCFTHEGQAMDVCVRTLEEAKEAGREVPLKFLKEFAELIEETKEAVALDIHEIRVHMWERKQHEWAPWARLPNLEQAFHRATEARRLCNYLWADRRVKDPGMIWALPVDAMLEDYA